MFRETVGDQKEIRREDFNKILLSKNVSQVPGHFEQKINPSLVTATHVIN